MFKKPKYQIIDIYHTHGFNRNTPLEETLKTLDDLIRVEGQVYCMPNFSCWYLIKSLSISERYGWSKYIAHQVYYSLAKHEFEWELMPLALDKKQEA